MPHLPQAPLVPLPPAAPPAACTVRANGEPHHVQMRDAVSGAHAECSDVVDLEVTERDEQVQRGALPEFMAR
jgi:hypothetical protein